MCFISLCFEAGLVGCPPWGEPGRVFRTWHHGFVSLEGAPPTTQPAPPGHPLSRRAVWLFVAVAVWALLLVVVAYVSVGRDAPTVREQRDLAQAVPVVDRALGELMAAAGTDVVTTISGAKLATGCRITPLRDGARLERSITIRTTEAYGPALLDRMAQRLPADYRARVRHGKGGTVHSLRADAGEFVAIRGGVTAPGVITLTVATGCRPTGGAELAELLPGVPIDDEPGRVLAALGTTPVGDGQRAGAPCPGGGAGYTARAVGRASGPTSLADKLRPLAGPSAVVVTDEPDRYAYRSGSLSVVVEVVDGQIRVATTSACPRQ